MDRDSLLAILQDAFPDAKLTHHGGWIMLPCPLAAYTHERGTDKNPSFGVSVHDNDVSIFHCLTCKRKGNLSRLFDLMYEYEQDTTWLDFADELKDEELALPIPKWDHLQKKRGERKPPLVPLDEEILDMYDDVLGHVYLHARDISDVTAQLLELRLDPADSHGHERILFPVRGLDGTLYGFTGRATNNDVEPRIRDYHGLPKRRLLLGAHLLDESDSQVVLVEGLFDYAKMREYEIPAVAVMHSGLTDDQADILKSIAKPVVVMFDNDKAGIEGTGKVIDVLRDHLPVLVANYDSVQLAGNRSLAYTDPGSLPEAIATRMVEDADLVL